jgi:hypothetical protein
LINLNHDALVLPLPSDLALGSPESLGSLALVFLSLVTKAFLNQQKVVNLTI